MIETITEVKDIHKNSSGNHLMLERRAEKWQEERRQRLISGMEK
ncbi:hypothetical protein [Xenorhabdus sp. KJ12.1]|nr:hypothetical protein [Xenorhabdus sp. KJ12.1]